MAAEGRRPLGTVGVPPSQVRGQLERVLTSVTFRQVDRLKRFLNFIVSASLAGRSDQLKEYVIGVHVFDKDSSFDPRADPILRVQARRLRARLVRYYQEEGGVDAVLIELPKGGYAPVFKNREASDIGQRSIGPTLAGQNTIAVQPFADLSPSQDLAYFCEGLLQEVIHGLAKLDALRVLAVSAGMDRSAQAAMVLTGGVRTSGDRVRVTVHLVDAATASYRWSESVDAALNDPFGAQELVADAVTKKLEPRPLDADVVIKNLEPRLLDAAQRRGPRRPASAGGAGDHLFILGQ